MSIPINVQRAIDNGYEFKTSDFLNAGFKNIHKNSGTYIVGAFLFFLILIILSAITGKITQEVGISLGLGALMVMQILSSLTQSAISSSLTAGFFNVAQKTELEKGVEIADLFVGFRKWKQLLMTAILTTIFVMIAALPGIILLMQTGIETFSMNDPEEMQDFIANFDFGDFWLPLLVMFIPVMYVAVSYTWAPMLTWFYDISTWDAMEASRKLANKNFFGLLGFLIVLFFIATAIFWLSFMLFFISIPLGIFLVVLAFLSLCYTLPLVVASNYCALSDIIQLNEDQSNEDTTIDHFAPNY